MTLAVFVTIAKCYKSVFLQHLMQTNVARNPEKLGYVAKQNVPKIAEKNVSQTPILQTFGKLTNVANAKYCKKNLWPNHHESPVKLELI